MSKRYQLTIQKLGTSARLGDVCARCPYVLLKRKYAKPCFLDFCRIFINGYPMSAKVSVRWDGISVSEYIDNPVHNHRASYNSPTRYSRKQVSFIHLCHLQQKQQFSGFETARMSRGPARYIRACL